MQAPKSWTFTDPDTGFKYESPTREALIQRIVGYRSQNKLPEIPHLDIVLENFLCGKPENIGKCAPETLNRSLRGYLKGGIALLKNYAYASFVPQGEADRRAHICTRCPYNVNPDKGYFEEWSDDLATAAVGPRRSKYHDRLYSCTVCSCPLSAKVWWGGEIDLSDEERAKMKAVNCWQPEVEAK